MKVEFTKDANRESDAWKGPEIFASWGTAGPFRSWVARAGKVPDPVPQEGVEL